MKRSLQTFLRIAMLLIVIPASASAHDDHTAGGKRVFSKHFNNSLFDISEHAFFSVEIILDESEYKIGSNVTGIVVHDAQDADVTGARIAASLVNSSTGEAIGTAATVREKGDGLYIVSGLDLKREGRLQLRITITHKDLTDSVAFFLPDALRERHPKGRYAP